LRVPTPLRIDFRIIGQRRRGGRVSLAKAFFQPASTNQTDIVTLASLGPRLGFAYDLTGEGKTVVKGFYGRFYFKPSTDIGSLENPVGAAQRVYTFRDLNGNRILDPGPDGSPSTSPELGALLRTQGGAGFVRVDRGLDNAYGDDRPGSGARTSAIWARGKRRLGTTSSWVDTSSLTTSE